MRQKRTLDRSVTVVRDANLIVIASEDTYAVRQYFDFFRSTRIQFRVLETQGGESAPEHVLARIDEYMKEYEVGEGDQFWIVCDCDHWITGGHIKNLVRVIQECRQKGIRVALSYPSFELWLLLHFAEFPAEAALSRAEIERRIKRAAGGFDKTKVYNLPIDNASVQAAVARSKANQHAATEIPDRLQTGVHCIIEELISQGIISVDE